MRRGREGISLESQSISCSLSQRSRHFNREGLMGGAPSSGRRRDEPVFHLRPLFESSRQAPLFPFVFDRVIILTNTPFVFAAPSGSAMVNDYSVCGTDASKIFRKRNGDLSSIPECRKPWTKTWPAFFERGEEARLMLYLRGSSESRPPAFFAWKIASSPSP
jgi:hypothetical protein